MLKGLTNTIKNACNDIELTLSEYIVIGGKTIPIKAELNDDCYDNGNFVGTFILKELKFEASNDISYINKEFEYYKRINGESIKIGTFITTEINNSDSEEVTKVVAMDYGLKTQVEYKSNLDYSSGNITLLDVWNECCELSGLESGVTEFTNSDFIVTNDQFTGTGATIRDVFIGIGLSSGSFIKVMNDDKIYPIFNEYDSNIKSGNNITLENDINNNHIDIQIDGKSEQTTYSGKQLFNLKPNNSNGLTVKIENTNTYTLNGTTTATYQDITTSMSKILEAGTYTMSVDKPQTFKINIKGKYEDDTIYQFGINVGSTKTTFTTTKAIKSLYIFTLMPVNTTINNVTFKLQLEKGNTNTEIEPYVGGTASPNPDYPQEIENVRGVENLLNIPDGTYTNNGVTAVAKGGIVTLNGTATATSFITINNVFNYTFKANQKYTISFNNKILINDTNVRFRFSKNFGIDVVKDFYFNNINSSQTFYFTEDTEVELIQIRTGVNITYDNFVIKPMLEKGIISHDYMPYGSNYLQLKNQSKNFLIYPYIFKSAYTDKGITYVPNNDGSVTINGTATSDSWFALSNNTQDWYLDGSETYEFTVFDKNEASVNGITPQYWSAKTGHHRGQNGVLTLNYSEDNTTSWNFVIFVFKGTTVSNVTVYPMIRKANIQDTSFEPYKSESTLIDLKGNELCSNKEQTLKDDLIIENGKAKIIKKYDEVVLNGTEDFGKTEEGFVLVTNDWGNKNKSATLSNYFTTYTNYSEFKEAKEGAGFLYENVNNFYIKIDGATTVNEFKVKLKSLYDAGTPVKIYYALAEPQTISLGKITPLKLLEGTNNITTNDELQPNMKIEYSVINEIVEEYTELEDKRDTQPITCLRLGLSQIDGENVDIQDEELIKKYGENWLIINDNPFAYTQAKRVELINAIFDKVKGFGYSSFVSKTSFKPYLTCGDVIKFRNKAGELVKSIVLRYNHNFDEITLEAPSETSATVNYVYPTKDIDLIKRTEIIVDKNTNQITSLTQQTTSIQNDLQQNYYDITQTNQLIQTSSTGITNTFSEAGGNNIFRNTGLWFSQSDVNNPYEYWTGKNVSKQNTDKSSNGSLMMLKKGTLEQEQVVSNGNYTVSFKYKKLIQLATCKVIVNDNEYELTQMTDTEWQTGSKDADGNIVIKPLEVTSNHINVKFTSTVDNAIEIYDLMVNAGTVKLAYSQNENEVTTDTVNISKGITITSSSNDTKFKANADGIRIVDKNNEKTILTEFTDKGMSTKEMEVENGATIVKVLVQNVGSQTWFTRI